MTLSKVKIGILAIIGLVVAWIVINAAFRFFPARPEPLRTEMRLAPYREGMDLRAVYETFPANAKGQAELRILESNPDAWLERWLLLEQAEESIDISYFILKQDVFGAAFLGHLLKKAKAGVKVRVLLDAFGSKLSWHPEGNDYLDALVNTGNVEMRMYRPMYDRVAEGLLNLSLAVTVASEHDKILVVDGKRAITGGRNIAREYFAHPDDFDGVFHDMGVLIEHEEAAATLTAAFEVQYNSEWAQPVTREVIDLASQDRDLAWAYEVMDDWLHGREFAQPTRQAMQEKGLSWVADLIELPRLKGLLKQPRAPIYSAEIRILDSATRFDDPDDIISEAVARLVKTARREIFILNPYVVLPDQAVGVFAEAGSRDVPITLLTNSPASSDSVVSQAFFLHQWPYLLASIPSLQLYGNGEKHMIHSKVASFDQTLSLVGTYNLSPLSMATNSEVVIAVWSPLFAERLTEQSRAKIATGQPQVFRYRIARHADGSPVLDEQGEPVPEFGPEDHVDISGNTKLQALLKAIKAAKALPGGSPFF